MTANSWTAQAIAFALTSAPTAVWLMLAQRAAARRGGPKFGFPIAIMTIVLTGLYVPMARLRSTLSFHLAMTGRFELDGYLNYWVWIALVPSLLLGLYAAFLFKRRFPLLVLLLAGSVAGAAGLTFEHGTHGWWYIQSEGLAYIATLSIFFVLWHGLGGGVLLYWARRTRWHRPGFCDDCGYDLRGSTVASTTCPECGGATKPTA